MCLTVGRLYRWELGIQILTVIKLVSSPSSCSPIRHCMLALINLKNEPILSMNNPLEWNDIDLRIHVYILYFKIYTYLDYINLLYTTRYLATSVLYITAAAESCVS